MKQWQKTSIKGVLEVTVVIVLYQVLVRVLVGQVTVSRVFASGPHVGWSTQTIVALFLVTRFLVVVALPGMILARLGLALWDLAGQSFTSSVAMSSQK